MRESELIVKTPQDFEFDFLEGQTKSLTYEIINNSDWTVKNIVFDVWTVKKTFINNKEEIVKTNENYVEKVSGIPSSLKRKSKALVTVTIKLPEEYTEKSITKDGESVVFPFRVAYSVTGHKYVKEDIN